MLKSLTAAAVLLLVAGCGGSQTANNPSPSSNPSSEVSPSPSAPASLDPCLLVTSQEASQLAGTTFGPGLEQAVSGGAKMCVYGYQTLNVFMVEVAVAPDAATAQAAWNQEEAQAQASIKQLVASEGASMNLVAGEITLSGADKAAAATASKTISGRLISISAIYVLKGAVFFTFSDLVAGHAAPTTAAMATQAETVMTRLP